MSTIVISGFTPRITPFMLPINQSRVPKSVVKVMMLMGKHDCGATTIQTLAHSNRNNRRFIGKPPPNPPSEPSLAMTR